MVYIFGSVKMRFSVILLLFLPTLAVANLMGVDLGLNYIKVAVARPGKGLELVTNEQAKRKTPAAVGFTEENERLFGDAAVAYAAKAPHRVILDGRSLIGRCADLDDQSNDDKNSPFCPHYRLNVEGVGKFSGEEVVAMLLAMARRQASAFLGGAPVRDVAVTVPAWYDERQRLAVFDAARVIGLNCLGVVNANTAAAIKYALDGKAKPTDALIEEEKNKDKKKRAPKYVTQRVLFYDVGAGSASASVAEITSDVKTGIASGVKMLSHASELGISGRLLDDVIVQRLADAFDQQRGSSATPSRDLPRVMTRLRKEAQRAREVLSANTQTFVSIGSLHDDIDLRTTINRADFEADAESMLSLVGAPAKAAMTKASLSSTDLHAVVPFGGASRTPRIQEELCTALGISSLNKSINTDEAAVIGSVFFAASLSSTFRVRRMDVDDVYGRGVSVEIDRDGGSGGLFSGKAKKAFQTVEVFPDSGSKLPSKKTVSLSRENDFSMRIFLNMDKSGMARFSDRALYAKVNINGVSDVLKKLSDKKKAKSTVPRVAISFHIDKSGLIRIGTAESSIDETVVVEREVEIKEEKKESKKTGTEKDETKSTNENSKDENEMITKEPNATGEPSDDKAKEQEKKKTRIEKSTQTVVHRHTLTVEYVEGEGVLGMQMSGKELEDAQKDLKNLEVADKERVERADAYNSLEGYILEVRSTVRGVDEDDIMFKVTTEEEREALIQAFDEAEDWMYTAEAKQIANLRNKHFALQKVYDPIDKRAKDFETRPKLVKRFRSAVNESLERVAVLRKSHVSAKSEHVAELDKFPEFCKDLLEWMDMKELEQEKLKLTENPAFSIEDIVGKVQQLANEVERIVKLKIPVVVAPSPDVVENDGKENRKGDGGEANASNSTESEKDGEEGERENENVKPNPDGDSAQADAASGSSSKDEL